jgi:hypothetical protein
MKTNHFKYTPLLLAVLFASSNASALSYGGSVPGDHLQYVETPPGSGTLVVNNAPAIQDVINVNSNGNRGNVELFASSDSLSNAAFNAYTGTTTLEVGFNNGQSLSLSSLTAADWGSGPGSLLETWSTALLTTFGVFSPGNLALFEAQFVAAGGQQRLSDPNIQSVNVVGGVAHIGLAGFYDASTAGIVPPAFASLVAGGQISEIVKVTANGNPNNFQYLYAIGATPGSVATLSGVQTADGSYNANFDKTVTLDSFNPGTSVSVPEPSELALLFAGLTGFLGLRRKAVKS